MSFLTRASALQRFQGICRSISTSSVRCVYNYDDYKPGPLPKTTEEREAAAKKYNLHPSEYETYPDKDGLGYGDYPKLPDLGDEHKDLYYPWANLPHRRNFNEPLHVKADIYNETRYFAGWRPPVSVRNMWLAFLGTMGFLFGTYIILEPYPYFVPVTAKQLPKAGVVHYTFEPKERVETSATPESTESEEAEPEVPQEMTD